MDQQHLLLIQIYCELLPDIREAAKKHGYAIAVHGSLRRDFDLIAVPWIEECSDIETLVSAILSTMKLKQWMIDHCLNTPELKPHNRIAYMIPLGFGAYIDLSIIKN